MMRQYRRIRNSLPPDTILFFHLGDFYEMFYEDAREASRLLDIALTRRNQVPMCGVPCHSAEIYIARLIRAGRKVAICEQVEDPAAARGIVRREVTRIVTPGTVTTPEVLDSQKPNYLAALYHLRNNIGLAMLELSTGDFWVEQFAHPADVRQQLATFAPAECLVPDAPEKDRILAECLSGISATTITPAEAWTFDPDVAADTLRQHFGVHSLDGFGCAELPAAVGAAGAVLHYVTHSLRQDARHVRSLRRVHTEAFLLMDRHTVANLELVEPRNRPPTRRPATLLEVLDTTRTPMGARLLREWILRPLQDTDAIRRRQDAVAELASDPAFLDRLREKLTEIRDMERLVGRLSTGGGNARDLLSLARSLAVLPELKKLLDEPPHPALSALCGPLDTCEELSAELLRALVDEPPATTRDGGMIREGYSAELDELRSAARDGHRWITEYQAREQARTGIKSLKVRYNKVFGYYIEVTKSNLSLVPADYVRKQTLVNAERFVTDELKEYENRILGAQERARELEYQIFGELRARVLEQAEVIQRSSRGVAHLDVAACLAERARTLRYVRPQVDDSTRIEIRAGRHPVIECIPDSEPFVPNDTHLDTEENQLLVITGPNMAGKSTYIRQVALIVIMAQMGSFVPADQAEIGVVDRVFTRVGAGDELAAGRSTFMVEMQETAAILHNATPRSLIVLDEIGRGTSTFDGISIAWAVAEFLHNHPSVKARTLFATHYHELTDLALTLPGVRNYNVRVKEAGDQVIFLRRVVPGAADKSYGIHVARLAGLPDAVIERAREILANLEEGEFEEGRPKIARRRPGRRSGHEGQLELFPTPDRKEET